MSTLGKKLISAMQEAVTIAPYASRIHDLEVALAAEVEARREAEEETGRLRRAADMPTPEMIAAAWGAWRVRHQDKIGPGPAFVEAIHAAFAALPGPASRTEI